MKGPEQLPKELVWTTEGHLSDIAMTAIADGEEAILPRESFAHLGECPLCAEGVEAAAALSSSLGRALHEEPAEAPQQVRQAFPLWSAMLAVAVAAATTLLNFAALRAWIGRMWWTFSTGTPLLTRHAVSWIPHAWNWLPVMSLTAAMLLVLAGLSVARFAPRGREMRME
jgi:hypothetical protein